MTQISQRGGEGKEKGTSPKYERGRYLGRLGLKLVGHKRDEVNDVPVCE